MLFFLLLLEGLLNNTGPVTISAVNFRFPIVPRFSFRRGEESIAGPANSKLKRRSTGDRLWEGKW